LCDARRKLGVPLPPKNQLRPHLVRAKFGRVQGGREGGREGGRGGPVRHVQLGTTGQGRQARGGVTVGQDGWATDHREDAPAPCPMNTAPNEDHGENRSATRIDSCRGKSVNELTEQAIATGCVKSRQGNSLGVGFPCVFRRYWAHEPGKKKPRRHRRVIRCRVRKHRVPQKSPGGCSRWGRRGRGGSGGSS